MTAYIPALEQFAFDSSTRNHYAALVRVMLDIIKELPQEKEQVIELVRKLN